MMRTMTARTDFHFSRLPGHPFGMPTGLAAFARKVKLARSSEPKLRQLATGLGGGAAGTGLAFPVCSMGGEARPHRNQIPKGICPSAGASPSAGRC